MRAVDTPILVRRIVEHEAGENNNQVGLIASSERVCNKLGSHLSRIIGREGFQTLLNRAINLTARRFPSIIALKAKKNGSLGGLLDASQLDLDVVTALVEQIFDLLVTFIGEDLTLRIIIAVWPELEFDVDGAREIERP